MPNSLNSVNNNNSANHKYKITFTWDHEARVWFAASDDDVGLVLEHDSLDALIERVRAALPELLELNNKIHYDISLDYAILRQDRLVASG